jgi:hypothetical protein
LPAFVCQLIEVMPLATATYCLPPGKISDHAVADRWSAAEIRATSDSAAVKLKRIDPARPISELAEPSNRVLFESFRNA